MEHYGKTALVLYSNAAVKSLYYDALVLPPILINFCKIQICTFRQSQVMWVHSKHCLQFDGFRVRENMYIRFHHYFYQEE